MIDHSSTEFFFLAWMFSKNSFVSNKNNDRRPSRKAILFVYKTKLTFTHTSTFVHTSDRKYKCTDDLKKENPSIFEMNWCYCVMCKEKHQQIRIRWKCVRVFFFLFRCKWANKRINDKKQKKREEETKKSTRRHIVSILVYL